MRPAASSGGSGDGGSKREPTAARNLRRKVSGSLVEPDAYSASPPAANASTAGLPSATRVAGGSMTVSERTAAGPLRRGEHRDDASVRVSDEVISGLEQLRHERASDSKSTRSTGGFGGKPGRSTDDELEPLGERLLNGPRRSRAHHAAVNEDEPLHTRHPTAVTKCRRFRLNEGKSAVTSTVICSAWDDAGRGPLTSLTRHCLGTSPGSTRGCDGARRARRLGVRRSGNRPPDRGDRRDSARCGSSSTRSTAGRAAR